jgi:hypothetical protein
MMTFQGNDSSVDIEPVAEDVNDALRIIRSWDDGGDDDNDNHDDDHARRRIGW